MRVGGKNYVIAETQQVPQAGNCVYFIQVLILFIIGKIKP